MLIYIATNKITDKSYIGKTIFELSDRKIQHIHDAEKNNTKMYFHRSICKYGKNKFSWSILWEGRCSDEWLNELEKYYIYHYDTFNDGYNMTEGGNGGALWTKKRIPKERRLELGKRIARIRDNTYLKNGVFKNMTLEERRKNVARRNNDYLKGKNNPFCKLTPEKRMEVILSGNEKRRKYRASDESKRKMSETRKRIYKGRNNPMSKVYKLISPENTIFIVKDGLENFCNKFNLSFGMIRKNLKSNSIIQRTIKNRSSTKTENTIGWRASQCQ